MIHNYHCTFLYHLNLLLLLCRLGLQPVYFFLHRYGFLKCSPFTVFSKFPIVQHDRQDILKYCFPNQSDFCFHPIFQHSRLPPYTFFWKRCFHTSKQTFYEKNISPSLNMHFWKNIRDIISVCSNFLFLICTFKSASVKNRPQPSDRGRFPF